MMKKALPLLAALPLAACISFGAKPPPTLLTLDAAQQVAVGQTQSSATTSTITVLVPSVPQELATPRVPVQATGTSVAYIKNAQWTEPPARLFARLVSDTVGARTGRVVLSQSQSLADPGARLTGELRDFGIDASSNSAVVTFDAALIRGQDNPKAAVEKRRFQAKVPVAAIDAASAGTGLNQAANQVAAEVADWVGR